MKRDKEKERFNQDYARLVEHCRRCGWEVNEIENSLVAEVEEEGMIKIGCLLSPRIKLYSLLHEIGHLEIWKDDYERKYPGLCKNERHKHFQAACVEEEIKAWDIGFDLACKLNIKIDMKKWNSHRYDCIFSYIKKSRSHRKLHI